MSALRESAHDVASQGARHVERRHDRREVTNAHELSAIGLHDRTVARQHAVEALDHDGLDGESMVERGAERAAVERAEHAVLRARALRKEEQAAAARARRGDAARHLLERRQLAHVALEEAREPRDRAEDRTRSM